MTDKAKQCISEYVQNIVNNSSYQFQDVLLNGVTPDMDRDKIFSKMILNSISLSTNLATQIILQILDDSGILTITSDDHALQKFSLKLHTDTLKK